MSSNVTYYSWRLEATTTVNLPLPVAMTDLTPILASGATGINLRAEDGYNTRFAGPLDFDIIDSGSPPAPHHHLWVYPSSRIGRLSTRNCWI